jgi:hypothetical protein
MTNTKMEMTSTELAFYSLGEILAGTRNRLKFETQFSLIKQALTRLQKLEESLKTSNSSTFQHWLDLRENSNIAAYACILDLREQIQALEQDLTNQEFRAQFYKNILGNRIDSIETFIKQKEND